MITDRLCEKLKEYKNDNIMLISHSMGTIIALDVLNYIVPDIRINTFITMGSPLGLPFIISKIAAELQQRGKQSNVLKTPEGITKNWYNFSDILDKVSFNYKLSESFSMNSFGIKPIDLLVINNYEFNGIRNPHKSFGYLRTPQFSKLLAEFSQTGRISIGQKFLESIKKIKSKIHFPKSIEELE
jgi:hypothetical protein